MKGKERRNHQWANKSETGTGFFLCTELTDEHQSTCLRKLGVAIDLITGVFGIDRAIVLNVSDHLLLDCDGV